MTICIQNDRRKSHGHCIKSTRMRKTSNRRSIRLHWGENWRSSIKLAGWNQNIRLKHFYLGAPTPFFHFVWFALKENVKSARILWKIIEICSFACWKIRFKTEVCACSQFPTEAMQWIKEVELVDSLDELRSSSSTRGVSMSSFKALDARIASTLSKIIHNSHFKRIISLPFPSRLTDCLLDLRTIPGHWYRWFCRKLSDLFTNALRNGDIQEFDSKWDGMLLSLTKIPHDDILEGLYKLRTRESAGPDWNCTTWRLIKRS